MNGVFFVCTHFFIEIRILWFLLWLPHVVRFELNSKVANQMNIVLVGGVFIW